MGHDISKWNVLEESTEYEDNFISIVKQQLMQPDGKQKEYSLVKRPHPFSIIIPFTDNAHTYLVGQYRIPIKKVSWEFPMGSVAGKNPLETAKQELMEETGLTAATWKQIGSFYPACGVMDQQAFVFKALELVPGTSKPETGEFLELQIVPFADIPLLIKNGTIFDGPTIAAYHYCLLDESASA